MKCPRCQHDNREGRRFCAECGASLALACSACGFSNEPGEKFCGGCGAPLGAPARTATSSRFSSPESYTPKHLAERILTSKAALEGERKQVTVLFADLKGSMELLADRDPEDARKILDPVLEHMMEAVHRYEGTVNQVMGDGIMALFGAPLAHEDHAVRACYAALRMQESVKRYAEGVRREQGVTVRIRVGLNSGEVVVRAIGSDLHMDYTAVGQTTHLAARMEHLADPGSILLTPDTLTLAEGFVQVTPLGPMAVKGLPVPVEVYELAGVSAVRSRLQAAAARGLSRFVGRDAEVEQLRRALEQARQGRGQIAAVVGEPGVGKSRLVFELTHSHRVEGWLVLESGSVSYGKATSYLPVIDLLKGYFRVSDRDTHRDIREKVTGKILTLDRGLEPILPALLTLLDVPADDLQWQGLDPAQRRQRTLDAVKRLLLRESQVQPLVVIFEDLHWVDTETQALLESLVESLPSARLLLLVNYRPEYSHSWGNKTYYTQLRLDALPPESAGELLEALLGSDADLMPLKQVLAARTGGNPLFLEESVRTLVETGALIGARGGYRLAKPLGDIHVPATVQAILAARIDRLPSEEKQLLQCAAVVGKHVPYALLAAIAEEPEERLRTLIAHLQAAEFLYETSLFPDLEYTFKHALTHEVAYGGLLQERRRVLHGGIVATIEASYRDRLSEHVESLAHHATRAELWDKAAVYSRQAGAKAVARWANREAVTHLEQALGALKKFGDTPESGRQGIDVRCLLRDSLFPLGEIARMLDYLSEARALADHYGDFPRLGRVLGYMTHCYWWMGDLDRAFESGEQALAIAATGNSMLAAVTRFYLGQVCQATGQYRKGAEILRTNINNLDTDAQQSRLGGSTLPALCRVWLAWNLSELGEFEQGAAVADEALALAEGLGQPDALIGAHLAVGVVALGKGDLLDAIRALEQSVQLFRRWDHPAWYGSASFLAIGYTLTGRVDEATALAVQTVEQYDSMGMRCNEALWIAFLGEAYLGAGSPDDAIRAAKRALDYAERYKERGHEAHTLRLLGALATWGGAWEAAEGYYQKAVQLATELGMRPLVAHCHLGLGKLYRRTGKREQAQEHLTTATTMYRQMDMRFWLEKAEAEVNGLS